MPDAGFDPDTGHYRGAANNTYMEVLPDTRVTHDDKLISGENFSNAAGEMAVLHYKIMFNTPGRYYVWVRAFSTGFEFDRFLLSNAKDYSPEGLGPALIIQTHYD